MVGWGKWWGKVQVEWGKWWGGVSGGVRCK